VAAGVVDAEAAGVLVGAAVVVAAAPGAVAVAAGSATT
jgi:hypothetical protein